MLWAILALVGLIIGLALLAYSSDKAVEHSVRIALEWKLSPLIIGLVFVSLGTDLPEIVNSIMSSALGHGDINVGDSLGSVLTQMTLVLGLLPFLGGKFKVKRKDVAVIGACEVLALMLAVSIAEKGSISNINGLFLVASWPIFMLLTRSATAKATAKNPVKKEKQIAAPTDEKHLRHFWMACLGFVGVAIGAFIMIESVITLSAFFQVSEYLISFFVVAIGTSLPELVVELAAIRKKQYELAIGDAIGSCVVDASFSIGIGPLIFPVEVSGGLVVITGLYAIFGSIVVILTLALGERVNKMVGGFFIFLYLLSYATLYA
jgi:cation:H+ antiporter